MTNPAPQHPVTGEPELDDDQVRRLIQDVAQDIYDFDVIAARYGLGGKPGLRRYLAAHPGVFREIQRVKSLWESDEGIKDRVKIHALIALDQAIPSMGARVLDPLTPGGTAVDGFNALIKASTLGETQGGKTAGAAPGTSFAVNIHFSSQNRVESVQTTVVEEQGPALIEAQP